ncbi:MAG TPA: hypothetical protein VK487_05110 [Candidatus Bathyarchaeia archaeon]|nr:hypothetical protein [Candidatus Bathyarchaeia archaeon]
MKKTAVTIQNSTDAYHKSLDLTPTNMTMERKNAYNAKNRVATMNGLANHQYPDASPPTSPPPTALSATKSRKRKPNPNEPSNVSSATIDTPMGLKLNLSPAITKKRQKTSIPCTK